MVLLTNSTYREPLIKYTINQADTVWIICSAALVFITIPGGALFYSGTVNYSKNKLSTLFTCMMSSVIVSILWFMFGYSLVYSPSGCFFIGNFENAFLHNVDDVPHVLAPTVPSNAFMIFQCMFATVAVTLPFGSILERTPIRVYLIFSALWSIFVYDFIACWTWGPNGWLRKLGVMDYAGGTPIHISAGFTGLACSIAVGPRKGYPEKIFRPHNMTEVFIGTIILWFGWFGFNAGSELAINSRSVDSFIVTNLSACFASIGWIITEMIINKTKKMSLYGFCCGAISGLVVITPASGFVSPKTTIVFGLLSGFFCCLACKLKKIFHYDDSSDVFAVHGIGGSVGALLTGIFAENSIISIAYPNSKPGGWLNANFIQVVYQLVSVVSSAAWSFLISFLILKLINLIPILKIKSNEKEEKLGIDWSDLGEQAYGHDIEIMNI